MGNLSPKIQIELFQDSFDRCKKEDFLTAFYEHFVNISPEIHEKFEGVDIVRVKNMTYESFYYMMMASNEGLGASLNLDRLGEFHSKRGITPQMFDTWLDCLIDTAKEYDPQWSDKIEDSWRAVMNNGIRIMKEHLPH